MLHFGVLGPIQLKRQGAEVELPAIMWQRLLALLLARPNQPIQADSVIDQLWPGTPPRTARKTLHGYVHRLRRALGADDRLVFGPAGYLLVVHPGELDAQVFEELLRQAEAQKDSALLDRALALWRGDAFAGLPEVAVVETERARLEELRLTALEERFAALLDQGGHTALISELQATIVAQPYRERLRGQLMLALYRSGRQVDALEVYTRTRELLVEELGVEPSAELTQLHQDILRGEPSLAASVAKPPSLRFLPRDVPDFVGRRQDLDQLDQMARETGGVAVITAIAGTAGIGKTALAVHWGHRVAGRFPDGQLYVNLRGYDRSPPLRPIDALSHHLRCLGVPPDQLPVDMETAAARYRSLLAGRRMLILLDNARDAEQVRPLLPGEPDCLVVVTSRDRLTGLIARDGAQRLTLGALRDSEAMELLRQLTGDRVGAEPAAARALVGLCAGLPLALRIAGALLADRPELTIESYVDELRSSGRVRNLGIEGDETYTVQAVLDQSVQALPEAARRAFELLGSVPGPDFTAEALSALVPGSAVLSTLEILASAHLVETRAGMRFAFHDLIREYAGSIPAVGREAALDRYLDYLREGASAANSLLRSEPVPEGWSTRLTSPAEAMAWLDSELSNVVSAVAHAVSTGRPQTAVALAKVLSHFFLRAGHVSVWINTFELALAAAESAGDLTAVYFILNSLGNAYSMSGRYDQAIEVYQRCVEGRKAMGDLAGAASTHNNLSLPFHMKGRFDEAIGTLETALELARQAGDRHIEALALSSNLPKALVALGRLDQAREAMEQALVLYREIGTPNQIGWALSNISDVYERLGRLDDAQAALEEATAVAHASGDRRQQAFVLANLAEVRRAQGSHAEAVEAREQATERFRELGLRSVECESLTKLGSTYVAAGRPERALEVYREAQALAAQIGARFEQCRALVAIAVLSHDDELLQTALASLEELSPAEAEAVLAELATLSASPK